MKVQAKSVPVTEYSSGIRQASAIFLLMKKLIASLSLALTTFAISFPVDLVVKVTDGRIAIEDASIMIPQNKAGLMTDENGICIFKNLAEGQYTIYAMLPGYEKYSNTIAVKASVLTTNIDIRLKPSAYSLGKISVESKRNRGRVDSQTTIKQEDMEANSQALINDSFKTLQLMPGVSSCGSIVDSSMFIQGGNNYEWVACMDGMIITDPMRWAGGTSSVSMFNPNFVDSISLYTSAYPAMYGQGLSGIVVVDTINGSKDRWKGFIDVSGVESEILVEGPITSNLTVAFDMRRTYYDLIMPIFESSDGSKISYPYIWDGIMKICWDITPEDRLTFDAYFSLEGENLNVTSYNVTNAPQTFGNFLGNVNYQILNIIGSAKYTHRINSGDSFDIVAGALPTIGNVYYSQSEAISLTENYGQYLYELGTDYYLNSLKGNKLQIGIMTMYLNPFYASLQTSQYMLTPQGQWTNFQNENININSLRASYYSAYIEDNYEIIPSIIVELGGREEYYSLNNEYGFNPQGGIKWETTKELDFYLRGGFYHYFPWDFLEINSTTGNPELKSEKVYHAIAGMEYSDADYMFRVEGFYKYYYDLIEADSVLNYNNNGIRNVYGGDIYLQKKQRKGDWLSGWISYTYVNGQEEITNRSPEDPNNPYTASLDQFFAPYFIRSHTISALVELTYYKNAGVSSFFDFMNEWKFSMELSAMSGVPYTPVTNYTAMNVNGGTQYYFFNGAYDSLFTPWYFRLDLKLTIPVGGNFLTGLLGPYARMFVYLGLINAFNNNNVISCSYVVNNGTLQLSQLKDWAIAPVGGFRIEF